MDTEVFNTSASYSSASSMAIHHQVSGHWVRAWSSSAASIQWMNPPFIDLWLPASFKHPFPTSSSFYTHPPHPPPTASSICALSTTLFSQLHPLVQIPTPQLDLYQPCLFITQSREPDRQFLHSRALHRHRLRSCGLRCRRMKSSLETVIHDVVGGGGRLGGGLEGSGVKVKRKCWTGVVEEVVGGLRAWQEVRG